MNEFTKLIEDFCASAGIDDASALLHDGLFEMEDVYMRVDHLPEGGLCRVVADLGEIPDERESSLRELMLKINYDNAETGLPVFSVHPETGHAVISIHMPVSDLLQSGGLMEAIQDGLLPAVEWWHDMAANGTEHTA